MWMVIGMAGVSCMKSLEETCFTRILMTLEEYAVEYLALLPTRYRNRMLNIYSLPVVDICRLETCDQFTSGLDMDSVWMKVYKACIDPFCKSPPSNWREEFFITLCSNILQDCRPYGYFLRSRRCLAPSTVKEHFVDEVNYLVATKRSPPYMSGICRLRKSNFGNRTMVRSHVTQERGIVPPGRVYHEACRSEQLVPPRYAKFFPEGSCFLPDFTALQLISNQCHFLPKKVDIPHNSTFFLHAEHEGTTDLKFLANFLKEVDSFTGHDKGVLLGLILSNASPKLAALDISADRIPEMTPILTSAYNRLMELSVEFHPKYKILLDLSMFISILEYHSLLHTISISIGGVSLRPGLPLPLLHSLIHTCFKKPNLCHLKLKLHLKAISTEFLLQILSQFLSTPCSHDQTLTLCLDGCAKPQTDNWLPVSSLYQFDNVYTEHKSLVFQCCKFQTSFISSVFKLQSLKLKELSIHASGSFIFSQLAKAPGFDIQSLNITSVDMNNIISLNDYDALLQKKSLKKVSIIGCRADYSLIRKAAALRGFRWEEEGSKLGSSRSVCLHRE